MVNWKFVAVGVVFAFALAGMGVGMYFVGYNDQPTDEQLERVDISAKLLDEIKVENIDTYIEHLASVPHLAGTDQDLEQANWVADRFREFEFDEVNVVPYEVLLSYPKWDKPNKVYLLDESGEAVFTTNGTQVPIYSQEESSSIVPPNFNAYSAPGTVEGDLVYVYFGREEDYAELTKAGVDVRGKIVLARYGAIFRGNIVAIAESKGATGVILFSDPQNYAADGRNFVYADSIWMPGMAVQSGSLFLGQGDPLTPHYPSLDTAYRIDQSEADLPKIPVQPIGYDEAEIFLKAMKRTEAPASWQGDLNTTYYLGPGMETAGWRVKLEVHTSNKMATIHNTIGVIRGEEEPDRYVLIGNHRDAWILGSIDPSSGTAAMLEIARAFSVMKRDQNWRPRRSLVFCSWGAEEYGLIGSFEFVEQHSRVLSQRAVAYLNVDIAVSGNHTLRVRAAPLLRTLMIESSKKIPNPNAAEVAIGRQTVFDTWKANYPDEELSGQPKVDYLGSGSDYAAFMYCAGVPSVDFNYAFKPTITGAYFYPLYHTLYETHHLAGKLMDPGFLHHRAIAQLWAEVARNLTDSDILPFDVPWYAQQLTKSLEDLEIRYAAQLGESGVVLDNLQTAVAKFAEIGAAYVEETLTRVDSNDLLAVRQVNDQLIQLERHFIDPRGLPDRPVYNHVVFSPSSKDNYASSLFSGLTDLLETLGDQSEAEKPALWAQVKQHLSVITFYIDAAARSLSSAL